MGENSKGLRTLSGKSWDGGGYPVRKNVPKYILRSDLVVGTLFQSREFTGRCISE